jgi:hypothetical protein
MSGIIEDEEEIRGYVTNLSKGKPRVNQFYGKAPQSDVESTTAPPQFNAGAYGVLPSKQQADVYATNQNRGYGVLPSAEAVVEAKR